MEKKTVSGKAESKHWRREATLRDILDLLDGIEQSNQSPEEKAKLRQRVIDYGQHLSEEIYQGKREVPASDDNETIKEFNLRMYGTYNTKGQSSYEEAKNPRGYYDEKEEFIKNPKYTPNKEPHGAKNPRWHPIPLKEETIITDGPWPRVRGTDDTDDRTGGGTGGTGGRTGRSGGGGNSTGGGGRTGRSGGGGNSTDTGGRTGGGPLTRTSSTQANTNGGGDLVPTENYPVKQTKNKRRYPNPLWFIPLVTLPTTLSRSDSPEFKTFPEDTKDKKEIVTDTPVLSQAERITLSYTVSKGQRMVTHQFGLGHDVDKGAEIYNQFVDNIKKGKIPAEMKDLTKTYNMSVMIDEGTGINLDRAEITATTWMVISESYPAIMPIIHRAITNPETEISAREAMKLKKYLDMAETAAKTHQANPNSNRVVTVDYGLYGADRQTGRSINFRDAQKDVKDYGNLVKRALDKGKDY